MDEMRQKVRNIVEQAARLLSDNGEQARADDLSDALAFMEQDLVRIDVVGLEKAGKSSLVNAILGQDMAEVGANPTTSAPTAYPAPEQGIVLLDHPGFDSAVFSAAETEASVGRSDLILYVALPEDADERQAHRQVERYADELGKPLIFVVNEDPEQCGPTLSELRQALFGRLARPVRCVPVHCKWAMNAALAGQEAGADRCGLKRLRWQLGSEAVGDRARLKLSAPLARTREHLGHLCDGISANMERAGGEHAGLTAELRGHVGTFKKDLDETLLRIIEQTVYPVVNNTKHRLFGMLDAGEDQEAQRAALDACNQEIQGAVDSVYKRMDGAMRDRWMELLMLLEDNPALERLQQAEVAVKVDLTGIDLDDAGTKETRARLEKVAATLMREGMGRLKAAPAARGGAKDLTISVAGMSDRKVRALAGLAGKHADRVERAGDKLVVRGMKSGHRKLSERAAKDGGNVVMRPSDAGGSLLEGLGKVAGLALAVGLMVHDLQKGDERRREHQQAMEASLSSYYIRLRDHLICDIEAQVADVARSLHQTLADMLTAHAEARDQQERVLDTAQGLVVRVETLERWISAGLSKH